MINEFPVFLDYKDRCYAVRGYIGKVDNYKDNCGYIDKNGDIYICSYKKKPEHRDVPIIYVTNDSGKFKFEYKTVHSKTTTDAFKEDKLVSLSYDSILENSDENDVLYNEEALRDMNSAVSKWVPIMNDDDDPLKKIIKSIIIEKNIDINRLKHKFTNNYGLTNLKSALDSKTRMSISNFNIWCEILEVSYTIKITDNGKDRIDPLLIDLIYDSTNGYVKMDVDDEDE